ncbi:MAG: hypothetical protein SGI72_11735 [Planctomycetota bacterium]|nr:hypothetical protein [Planctomycetota bacterium]
MGFPPVFLHVALSLAFVVPAWAGLRQDAVETFSELHAKAVRALVVELEKLAAWSSEKELFLERDRVYRALLELDSDHAGARKGLRFSKKPDGSWAEPAPREVKNFNPKALLELPAKRAAAVAPFANTMRTAIERFDSDDATRGLVYREILFADPDDAETHASLGEVKSGENWVLLETQIGKQRRVELKELVRRALETSSKLTVAELTPLESSMGITFTQHYETAHVRVFGTGLLPEVEKAARACEAVADVAHFAFDTDIPHADGYTLFLLANSGESDLVLDQLPGISPSYRQFLKNVVGAKIPGQPYVVFWDKLVDKRVDGSVRQTIGDFLGRGFGITLDAGWAWEGFGLYLTRELVGTRLTWFVQEGGATKADTLKSRLLKPDANWINEALELLQKAERPPFATTLDRDVNAMGVSDVLYAYALAAYLIEARPTETAQLLQRIGQGIGDGREKTSAAIKTVLKLDAGGLERRLTRWLAERR